MVVSGFRNPYFTSPVSSPLLPPKVEPGGQGSPSSNMLAASPTPPADAFSHLTNTALLAQQPAFLATSPVGVSQPPLFPSAQLSSTAGSVPAAAPTAPLPQIVYVPVLQAPAQPPNGDLQAGARFEPDRGAAVKSTLTPDAEALELKPSPTEEGLPPNAQQVGYQVGKTVEKILGDDPELLAAADRLNLDDPDLLLKGVHGALAPAVNWMPEMVKNKIVERLPIDHQDLAQRFLDWLDKPFTSPNEGTRRQPAELQTRDSKSISSAEGERSAFPDPVLDLKKEPPEHNHQEDLSSLEDLFPADEPLDRKPSLKERLNPLNHLPLSSKESPFSLDKLLA